MRFYRRASDGALDHKGPFPITFEGRDFVWHSHPERLPERGEGRDFPVVTVMVADPSDYLEEALAAERFLSALSFAERVSMASANSGAASWPGPLDSPTVRAGGADSGWIATDVPARLEIANDDRLRLVLALHREAISADSPFYGFLAYWNALEASFDDDDKALNVFINASPVRAPGWFRDREIPAEGWSTYLRESSRNAVAHAVRAPGRPVLDPDDPRDRSRLTRDSDLLDHLLRYRVEERWGPYAVEAHR